MATKHRINWNTAEVKRDRDWLELRVQVEPADISTAWRNEFNEEASGRSRQARGQRWGSVEIWGETIIAKEIEADAESELRAFLEELVPIAERRESEILAETETQERERAARHEALDDAAKRMTDRLRSDDAS